MGVWRRFPRCFPLKSAQTSHCCVASVSSLWVRIWNFSFETNTGSGFPFLFYIHSDVTTISNSSRTPLHSTAHKNSNRAGFVLGWGVSVAVKILLRWKKVRYAAEKGWSARSSKDVKTWHPNWNSCRRGIQFVIFTCVSPYYRVKRFSSPFKIWKWVFHSFRAIHWLKQALVQKGHLAGPCPLYAGVYIKLQ